MDDAKAYRGDSGCFWDQRAVLVTGGGGFIGSHLVDALVEAGARVRVLDNFSTGRRQNVAHLLTRIEILEGDIRDRQLCRQAAEGVSHVFHQAALGSVPRSLEEPATTIEVNVTGTANIMAAAHEAGVKRVVYASSSSVYGDSPTRLKREGEEGAPLSPYAASKAMCEQIAHVFSRAFGMEPIGLRYFNVYGPRQDPRGPYAAVVPRFFTSYGAGEAAVIYGDGEQCRDFTYVADAVTANLLAASAASTAAGRAYNIGAGGSTSVNRMAELIRQLVGGGPEPEHGPPRRGDVRWSRADITAAHEALGYLPRVSLEEGLALTASGLLERRTGEKGRL